MDRLKAWLAETTFDFVGYRAPAAIVSAALVVGAWLAFFAVGPNWGIDFTGGTEIHLQFEEPVAIDDLRGTLASLDIPSDAIQEVGGDLEHEFKIRIKDASFGADALRKDVTERLVGAFGEGWLGGMQFSAEVGARFVVRYTGERVSTKLVADALAGLDGVKVEEGREDRELVIKLPGLATQVQREIGAAMGDRAFTVLSVDAVGPKVGESLRQQGFLSIMATLGLVLLYIGFRFDITFAPGAILALVHDVSVTVGAFVLLGKEFNLPIIGALLTIVGYSLNDTIVIYDRIRENRDRYARTDLLELINVSINETLTRTLATSTTTLFAVLPFLFMGSPVIRDFVLAMVFGITFGTYSTIFIASPMILVMERVRPALASLIALPETEQADEAEGDVPDAFLSEAEKRRRERARLEREQADGLAE